MQTPKAEEKPQRNPLSTYGPIVSVAIAAPILVTGIVLAIVIPIRKRKKVKDMTW